MIMPFVRLIAIYILVGLAVFAFFKRDAVMALVKGPETEAVTEVVAEPEMAATETPVNTPSEPVLTQPVAPEPVAEPVFAPTEPLAQPTPPSADTMMTRWAAARQAYWDGKGDEAEALYVALATDFPSEAAILGELGNLYYNSGRTADAANQFHAVGLLVIATGNRAETAAMIGILQSIAPDMAADLKARADSQN